MSTWKPPHSRQFGVALARSLTTVIFRWNLPPASPGFCKQSRLPWKSRRAGKAFSKLHSHRDVESVLEGPGPSTWLFPAVYKDMKLWSTRHPTASKRCVAWDGWFFWFGRFFNSHFAEEFLNELWMAVLDFHALVATFFSRLKRRRAQGGDGRGAISKQIPWVCDPTSKADPTDRSPDWLPEIPSVWMAGQHAQESEPFWSVSWVKTKLVAFYQFLNPQPFQSAVSYARQTYVPGIPKQAVFNGCLSIGWWTQHLYTWEM